MSRIPRVPTALVTAAALLAAGLAVLSFGRDASAAQDKPWVELVSRGATTGTAYRTAIRSNGEEMAYQSNEGGRSRILLSRTDGSKADPIELPSADTQATTPSMSGDASLVSFLGDLAGGTQENPKDPDIYVVDRRQPDAPKVKQVTGTQNDLPYQRMVDCTINNSDADGRGCEPKLSRDGSTLVAPVYQSVDSRRLELSVDGEGLYTELGLAPLMDFGAFDRSGESTLTVKNTGAVPVVYPETGPTIEGAGFTVKSTTCATTLAAGASCTVTVQFTGAADCDEESTGVLRLPATTSGGQTAINLTGGGECPRLAAFPPQVKAAAADCTGPSQYKWNLPAGEDPRQTESGPHALFAVGNVSAGELGITALNVRNDWGTPYIPRLRSTGCQLKFVLPANADPQTSCHPGEPIAPNTGCTAYVEYLVPDVAPFAATFSFGDSVYRITGHAMRSSVAAWRDPGAAGNFGPAQLVSVTGKDNVPMHAYGPTVSADGRWIGFTSKTALGRPPVDPQWAFDLTQVYLHDTDADGNGSHKPGATELVSLKPDGTMLRQADEASVSDDGTRISFSGQLRSDDIMHVFARDLPGKRTVMASVAPDGAPAGPGWSTNPQLSGDGGTVVYVSSATNLGVGDQAGDRIIARDLTKDFAGGRGTNELISVRPDGLGGADGDGWPSVNHDGVRVGFWSKDLLDEDDQAGPADPDVYFAIRDGSATLSPDKLDFGTTAVGKPVGPKPLTITNDGLTPIQFHRPNGVTGDFTLAGDQCTGKVIRPGQTCSYLVQFNPRYVGPRYDRFYTSTISPRRYFSVGAELNGRGTSDARTVGETSHVSTNDGRHTDPAISDNGQFVGYRSAVVNADARPTTINVRNQATKEITQFAKHGNVGPPVISGDGKRLAYTALDGRVTHTVVTDQSGSHPVTGTAADLPFQRPSDCDSSSYGPSCPPALSNDGKTVAFPARLSPDSPALSFELLGTDGGSSSRIESLIDFSGDYGERTLRVTADRAVRFTGPPTLDAGSIYEIESTTCTGDLAADSSCTIVISNTDCGSGSYISTLRLPGATPDGQAAISVVGNVICAFAPQRVEPKPAAACTPIAPAGHVPYLSRGETNAGNPVADNDNQPVGKVRYTALAVTPQPAAQTIRFRSGCDFAMVDAINPDPELPKPCVDGETLPANTGCTAYVGFRPEKVDPSVAYLTGYGETTELYRFAGVGIQDVVLTRTDTTGDGTFAGPVEIGSRDSAGAVIDGQAPSLSGDGRYLAFSSAASIDRPASDSKQIYRRDRVDGKTLLVSQLSDGEVGPDSTISPSLSASGDRIAFVSAGYRSENFKAKRQAAAAAEPDAHPSHVWARDIPAGKTVLVSAAAGKPTTRANDWSYDPSISDDGSTVGFSSEASDLVPEPGNDEMSIYVRQLDPDFAAKGERFNERMSVTETGVVPEEGASSSPSLNSDGAFSAFDSSSQLVTSDTDNHDDVYVRRRPAQLVVEPAAVDFGGVLIGKSSSLREMVVRNLGPGPAAAGPTKVDTPFAAGDKVCKVTLHRGENCTIDARFAPTVAGPVNGLMTLTSVQGYLPGPTVTAGLTGTGATAPPVAGFTVVPGKLVFPARELGKTGPALKVALKNTGAVPLSIAAGLTSAGDFGVEPTACATLMPGATCEYPVSFVARKAGTRTGSILFRPTSQDPLVKSPASVTVSLTGVGKPGPAVASMTVAPRALVFGTQVLLSTSAPQPVIVTNTGNVPLNVTGVTGASDFTAASAIACRGLLPGKMCEILVRFAPRSLGIRLGAVRVMAAAVGTAAPFPALVVLHGTTAVPTLAVEPPVVRPGQIVVATGTNFPPGRQVALAWNTGLGAQKVVADQTGRFQTAVLVFRRDRLGERLLTATMPGQPLPVNSLPVLVMPLGPQPPNFVLRW